MFVRNVVRMNFRCPFTTSVKKEAFLTTMNYVIICKRNKFNHYRVATLTALHLTFDIII